MISKNVELFLKRFFLLRAPYNTMYMGFFSNSHKVNIIFLNPVGAIHFQWKNRCYFQLHLILPDRITCRGVRK